MASLGSASDTTLFVLPGWAAETAASRGAAVSTAAENNAIGPRIHPGEWLPNLSVTQRSGRCQA